jgi:hypothetical protein
MSKRGKKRNAERRARKLETDGQNLLPWQAALIPLTEDKIDWVTENPFHLFMLDAKDEPAPIYEAFPGVVAMMVINCLHGESTTVVSQDGPLGFRRQIDPNGHVLVEFIGHDSHAPLYYATNLTGEMLAILRAKAEREEENFMRE